MIKIKVLAIQSIKENQSILSQMNSVQQHNYSFLRGVFKVGPKIRISAIQKIKQLSVFKIIKVLGEGAYGVVFLLEGDLVLKLYNPYTANEDSEKYGTMQQRLHSGVGSMGTLNVIAAGQLEPADDEAENYESHYVIMNKIIDLEEWLLKYIFAGNSDPYYAIQTQFELLFGPRLHSVNITRFSAETIYKHMSNNLKSSLYAVHAAHAVHAASVFEQHKQLFKDIIESVLEYLRHISGRNGVQDFGFRNMGIYFTQHGDYHIVPFDIM